MSTTFQAVQPRLTLVGAGPGDPELITLKGIRALEDAKVILYDALVNLDLLKYASAHCLKRFVGKRAGLHVYTQQEINKMSVQYALAHGHVVRLKGGDPFVFGRGYEEIAYAQKFNIATEVVPGISSAIALPELRKIPLTTRGLNESFWVLTGTTSDGQISDDLYHAAQTNATVVVLMGLKNLKQIMQIYREAGKNKVPVGVIQNGSLPDEQFVVGTIDDIDQKVKEAGVRSPAIIVIGEAVNLRLDAAQTLRNQVNLFQEVA